MKERKECPKCGSMVSKYAFTRHVRSCSGDAKGFNGGARKPKILIKDDWLLENGKYSCPYCNKEYSKKGIATHIWRNHGEGSTHKGGGGWNKGNSDFSWNKGLTKETSEKLKETSKKLSEHWKNNENNYKKWARLNPEAHRKACSKGGGLRRNSGKGHRGWYKGYWCDSSWELAFVIYNLDHNIIFERNNKFFEYIFKGKTSKYYPDFIIDGKYIEIKGYESERAKAKIQQFPEEITLLKWEEMQLYFKYVIETYGDDFIRLYDNVG